MNKLLSFLLIGFIIFSGNALAQLSEIQFEGSNSLRWENGDEVDERLNAEYPDNTIARRFVENQLRFNLYASNLRVGGRLLYFRPSDYDIYQYGISDTTHFDKLFIEAQISQLKLRAGDFSEIWGYA